jgi:DNA repair exonuclease SbcCD ATPase subunit
MVEKCKDLWNKNESLIETKNQVEINIDKLKKAIDEAPSLIRDEINNISVLNNKKKTELMLKENVIKKLKADLEKTRKNAFFKTARTEVLVTEPTKTSLEINQDLLIAKTILSKVSNMHSKEKKRSNKLEREAKNLREEMNKLKKKAINLYFSNLNKNEIKESTKSVSDENNFLVNLGYNLSVENNNKDDGEVEEEESEESEESSEEENSEENDEKEEEKSKEIEKLNEQYNKLKEKIDEYQKKINQYKTEYKSLKKKMDILKNTKPITEK